MGNSNSGIDSFFEFKLEVCFTSKSPSWCFTEGPFSPLVLVLVFRGQDLRADQNESCSLEDHGQTCTSFCFSGNMIRPGNILWLFPGRRSFRNKDLEILRVFALMEELQRFRSHYSFIEVKSRAMRLIKPGINSFLLPKHVLQLNKEPITGRNCRKYRYRLFIFPAIRPSSFAKRDVHYRLEGVGLITGLQFRHQYYLFEVEYRALEQGVKAPRTCAKIESGKKEELWTPRVHNRAMMIFRHVSA